MKKYGGTIEKNYLSNENLKYHSIGLNLDKNLDIAFGSYPVFSMSVEEN